KKNSPRAKKAQIIDEPNANESYDFDDFFNVNTIEIKKAESVKTSTSKKQGNNKRSNIPNEVLEDHTIDITNIVVSKDISNPNSSPLAEIDKILNDINNREVTKKEAEKSNDPFLVLLARTNDPDANIKFNENVNAKTSEKLSTKKNTAVTTKKVVKSNATVDKNQQEMLRRKEQQLRDKDRKSDV